MDQNDELDALKERISKLKPVPAPFKKTNNKLDALGISIEIVAGVIVGLITGILMDKIFTTKPLFLIICLILGMVASARTVWQKVKSSKNGT